ncbi:MAG: hypothetical protein R6U39_05860 [Candidatus Aegiribacteria sp.]
MKKGWSLWLFALLFLAVAVITGRMATMGTAAGDRAAVETITAGTGQLGRILADLLWIQLDRYHHIWMYQGHRWQTATDYLPQLWLITKLNPQFPDAYIDGGHHLAVNLDKPEEGFRLLDRGIRNCPDNERVYWERMIVLWETGYRGARGTRLAAWDYLELVRRKRGRISEPWNEANAAMILGFTFSGDSLRRNSSVISRRYDERAEFIRSARRSGLWTD